MELDNDSDILDAYTYDEEPLDGYHNFEQPQSRLLSRETTRTMGSSERPFMRQEDSMDVDSDARHDSRDISALFKDYENTIEGDVENRYPLPWEMENDEPTP